jgi:photosystem II stability/assembly factor-like uncharacterized protein
MKKIIILFTLFILLYTNIFAQSGWFEIYSNNSFRNGYIFFVDINTGYVSVQNRNSPHYSNLLKTTNSGNNWILYPFTNPNDSIYLGSLFFNNAYLGFSAGGEIYKTINGGINWTKKTTGINNWLFSIFFPSTNTGYAVGYSGQIKKTIDNGNNWSNQFVPSYMNSVYFVNDYTGYTVGWIPYGYYNSFKTTNGGGTWDSLNSINPHPLNDVFFINYNTGYIVGDSGTILKTHNAGTNWIVQNSNTLKNLMSVCFTDINTGYVVGYLGTIIKTTNGGLNWGGQSSGTTNRLYELSFLNNNTGYIVGDSSSILKTTNGGGPIGINPISSEVPNAFSLSQNYPNPFNPTTNIKFNIPKTSNVKLNIYDALGREVAVLVNEELKPGTYEVDWDASNYSSGIYYYTLQSGDYKETKKMVLIK